VTDGQTEDAAGIEATHVVKPDVGVIKGDLIVVYVRKSAR